MRLKKGDLVMWLCEADEGELGVVIGPGESRPNSITYMIYWTKSNNILQTQCNQETIRILSKNHES